VRSFDGRQAFAAEGLTVRVTLLSATAGRLSRAEGSAAETWSFWPGRLAARVILLALLRPEKHFGFAHTIQLNTPPQKGSATVENFPGRAFLDLNGGDSAHHIRTTRKKSRHSAEGERGRKTAGGGGFERAYIRANERTKLGMASVETLPASTDRPRLKTGPSACSEQPKSNPTKTQGSTRCQCYRRFQAEVAHDLGGLEWKVTQSLLTSSSFPPGRNTADRLQLQNHCSHPSF